MMFTTKEIVTVACKAALNDASSDLTYHVHCAYGENCGYGSTDMLSMSVKEELHKLGFVF